MCARWSCRAQAASGWAWLLSRKGRRSSFYSGAHHCQHSCSPSSLTWNVQEYPYHNKSTFLSMAFCNLMIYFKLHKSMTWLVWGHKESLFFFFFFQYAHRACKSSSMLKHTFQNACGVTSSRKAPFHLRFTSHKARICLHSAVPFQWPMKQSSAQLSSQRSYPGCVCWADDVPL